MAKTTRKKIPPAKNAWISAPTKNQLKFGQEFYKKEISFEKDPKKREAEQRMKAYQRKVDRDNLALAGRPQFETSLKVENAFRSVGKSYKKHKSTKPKKK